MNETSFLFFALVLALMLPRVPVVGIFFRLVNTMIHESAHALAALLSNGTVVHIDYQSDTSGTVLTRATSKWSQFIITLVGYPASSAAAALLIYLIKNKWFEGVLFGLFVVALVNLLLWVRNAFGIAWLITFILLTAGIFFYAPLFWRKMLAIFCSGVVLFDSVVSAYVLLIISIKNPRRAGDAHNLAVITGIPAVVWALLFLGCALFFAGLSALFFVDIDWIEQTIRTIRS